MIQNSHNILWEFLRFWWKLQNIRNALDRSRERYISWLHHLSYCKRRVVFFTTLYNNLIRDGPIVKWISTYMHKELKLKKVVPQVTTLWFHSSKQWGLFFFISLLVEQIDSQGYFFIIFECPYSITICLAPLFIMVLKKMTYRLKGGS